MTLLFILSILDLTTFFVYRLFYAMDQNGDGHISRNELRAMIVGLKFDEIELDKNDAVEKVMNDFDTSHDSQIDRNEFLFGISKWIHEAKRSGDDNDHRTMKFLFDFHLVRFDISN